MLAADRQNATSSNLNALSSMSRRGFLRGAACAGAALAVTPAFAGLLSTTKVPHWRVPQQQQVAQALFRDRVEDMWMDRALSLLDVLWPMLAVEALKEGVDIDDRFVARHMSLERMDAFARQHAHTPLGQRLSHYLDCVPGFRSGYTDQASIQHGYLTMQIVRHGKVIGRVVHAPVVAPPSWA